MKKNRKEYKDGTCFKTRTKYIKPKYQIKLELLSKSIILNHNDIKKYNQYLEEETEKIYNEQFLGEK